MAHEPRPGCWACADHPTLPWEHDDCGAMGRKCICNPTGAVQWKEILAEVPKDDGPLN